MRLHPLEATRVVGPCRQVFLPTSRAAAVVAMRAGCCLSAQVSAHALMRLTHARQWA